MKPATLLAVVWICLPGSRSFGNELDVGARGVSGAALPPFITVREHGGVKRDRFPVRGAIPLAEGALQPGGLARLRLLDEADRPVPAQLGVTGRWLDGSVKWLLLDFPSSQGPNSAIRYRLQRGDRAVTPPAPLARRKNDTVEVDTGRLRVSVGGGRTTISVRAAGGNWEPVVTEPIVSRTALQERGGPTVERYDLALDDVSIESNGSRRAVLKVEGWHTASDGARFSPSSVRLVFSRDQPFMELEHTFVMSANPNTHLLAGVWVDVPLAKPMREALFSAEGRVRPVRIGSDRIAVYQENLYRPKYPDFYTDREFEGRYRIFRGEETVRKGERYGGGVTLRGDTHGVGVYLKDCWQLSPKAVSYDPGARTLRVGLYPGELAGPLDLMRTELRDPEYYAAYRRQESESWGKYSPTYVQHDLVHSAMGMARTHTVILWFGADGPAPRSSDLEALFEKPFVPFVSGAWNVSTGALGKEVLPGRTASEVEETSKRMVALQREAIEEGGWYGWLTYGNVRYGWNKTHNRWMKLHPKYAWYHAGHNMNGGTHAQALWYHYLRFGDPDDYRLAEARARQVMDLSVVHYHEDPRWRGAMLRHGGPDPWVGHRSLRGGHYPLAGLPVYRYVTGDERAADVTRLIIDTNYRHRDFDLGRGTDTDLANMTLAYQFTLDRRYYDRAVEYVDHYYRHRNEAARNLTFFNYFTTAARWFYRVADDRAVRDRVRDVFLARYRTHLAERRTPGNPEMATFAYELEPGPRAARRVLESVESFRRRGSGQIGWYDNMLLVSPNELALTNAAAYAGYWVERIRGRKVTEPRLTPDGGTFGAPVEVTMACDTPGAVVRYTLDGSETTRSSIEYTRPIRVAASLTVRARAFKDGFEASDAVGADFAIERLGFPRRGLVAWYRSDRGVHRKGDRVVRWSDESGAGRHAVAGRRWVRPRREEKDADGLDETEASAPLFIPNAVGSLPVLQGGHGRYLQLRRFAALREDSTIAFVGSAARGDSGPFLGDADDGGIRVEDVPEGALSVRFNVGVPGARMPLRGRHEPGAFALWTVVRRGDRVTFYKGGRPLGEKTLPAVTPFNLEVLLARRPWTDFCRSELCELLVYDRALTAGEITALGEYVRSKYGDLSRVAPRVYRAHGGEETGETGETEESEEREPREETEETEEAAETEEGARTEEPEKSEEGRDRDG